MGRECIALSSPTDWGLEPVRAANKSLKQSLAWGFLRIFHTSYRKEVLRIYPLLSEPRLLLQRDDHQYGV